MLNRAVKGKKTKVAASPIVNCVQMQLHLKLCALYQAARGKKTKAAKAKAKYGNQDEEDRQLAMEFLASAGVFLYQMHCWSCLLSSASPTCAVHVFCLCSILVAYIFVAMLHISSLKSTFTAIQAASIATSEAL